MASIADMRGALIDCLRDAFPGWTVGRTLGPTPALVVGWPDMDPVRASFGSTGLWGSPDDPGLVFPVEVYVAHGVAEEAELALELVLNDTGDDSIAAAVEASGAMPSLIESATWEASRTLPVPEASGYLVAGVVAVRLIARRG